MRTAVLFTATVIATACSSASPPPQLPAPPPAPTPVDAAPIPDVLTVRSPGQRGDACSADATCDAGLSCLALAGGYCTAPCELGCSEGTSACVPTPTVGELCMKRCDRDQQCRTDEGYVCDPAFHACLLPNLQSPVPARCPLPAGAVAQDATFQPSQRWSGDALAGLSQHGPVAALTDDGGVVALYDSRDPMLPIGNVIASRVDGKGTATLEQAVPSSGERRSTPSLARDRKGVLYATWLVVNEQGGHPAIVLATSADRGVTWSTGVAVDDSDACAEGGRDCLDRPMVVVGPDPRKLATDIVYVVYATESGGVRVRASRDRGRTFGEPVTALPGTYGNATVGANGTLHLSMLSGDERGGFGSAQQLVLYASSTDGGQTFTAPAKVSGFDETLPFYFANPSLVVDTTRKLLYVAYVRGGRDARWELVLAVSRDAGVTWKRQKVAGDGCAIHMVPNLALDPSTGAIHLAYYDSEGASGRFVHASCTSGGVKCKVHGAINTVPFAALPMSRKSRTWLGERESLLVDSKRRQLHAVWTQVVEENGANVARIFHSSAKLK